MLPQYPYIFVLTAIFQVNLGQSVYRTWGWRRWWWQLELEDVQSSSQIITTNKPTPNVLQAGCPSCRPTNSVKALKGKVSHSTNLNCSPQAHLGSSNLVFDHERLLVTLGRVTEPLIGPPMPYPAMHQTWNCCSQQRPTATVPNLVVLGQISVITDIGQKFDPSRSLRITQGHWNLHRSIGYLWLPISDSEESNGVISCSE